MDSPLPLRDRPRRIVRPTFSGHSPSPGGAMVMTVSVAAHLKTRSHLLAPPTIQISENAGLQLWQ
jgi:hypothetical protein